MRESFQLTLLFLGILCSTAVSAHSSNDTDPANFWQSSKMDESTVFNWLVTGVVAEPETTTQLSQVSSMSMMCVDTAGTSVRTINGTPMGLVTIANFGDQINIVHNLDSIISGDGDPLTTPGVDLGIYLNFPPTISGPTSAAINSDPTFTTNVVGTNQAGSINFMAGTTYQNTYNGGNPVQLWFAHITLDEHSTGTITENAGSPDECANVSVSDAFSVIFLNPLDTSNFTHPAGNNLCAAQINISGGLPQWDASNYTFAVEEVTGAGVGTVTTPSVTHNGVLSFTVPQPGDYNIIVSDNNGGLDTFMVTMSSCITCTDDAGTLNTTLSTGAQSGNQNFLCVGDSLILNHDGNQDVSGDPGSTTAPGLGYVMYTCQPTTGGITVASIASDPCIINQSGSSAGFDIVSNIDINGNGAIINNGILYQNLLGGPGATGTLWFAPITLDNHATGGFEGVGTPNECTNVNIGAAFPATFLNEIVANNFSTNLCSGTFDVAGGLPELAGNNSGYVISITANSSSDVGTVTNNPVGHNGTVNFTVPTPGIYTITVTDTIGCTSLNNTHTFQIAMTTCPFPCAGVISSTSSVTSNYNGSNISCNGAADGQITVNTVGGVAPLSFLWSHDPLLNDSIASNIGPGTYTTIVTDANGCADTVSATLTEPSILFVTLDEENPLCNGEASGLVNVDNIGGGTAPYTFAWSAGTPTPSGDSIINLTAGAYSLTVTDANNCMATASTNIGDPAVLLASFSSITNTDCAASSNGEAIITPSGGTNTNNIYSYAWSHDIAEQDSVAQGLTVGQYIVTVTDDNGCQVIDSVMIMADKTITTDMDSVDISCFGANDGMAMVVANTIGGTANLPYTYSWSHNFALNNDTASNLTAGTYIVTVTDAVGCFAIDSIVVNQPDSIDITLQSITNVACFGNSTGGALVSVSGGTMPYTYNWSNSSPTSSISNVPAGTYTLTVTDANNCTKDFSVIIDQADSLFIGQIDTVSISCPGDVNGSFQVTPFGGTLPYSYAWSSNPAIDTFATLANIGAGIYTVTVTDANNCTFTQTLEMTDPPALQTNIGGQDQSCSNIQDGMVFVNVSGGTAPYSYSWSNTSITDTVRNLPAGFYGVTITDAANCTIEDTITIFSPPPISIGVTTTPVSCPGGFDGTATVTASGGTGGFTYLWDSLQTGQTATQLTAGTHVVIVTDQTGCFVSDTFDIVEIPRMVPTQLLTTPVSCFAGSDGSATIVVSGGTAPYTYSWNTNPPQDSSTATNLVAGAYEVQVTDANGCALPPISLTVNQPAAPLSAITSAINPNCANGENGSITVTPTGGTASYTYQWDDPNNQTTPTAIGLTQGTYNVTITDANGCTTTASGILTDPLPLFVQTIVTPTTCNGGKDGRIELDTVLGGTSPYSYSIDGINFLPTDVPFFGLFGGNYTIIVKDAVGCTWEEDVLIQEPPLIVVDLGPDIELDLGDTAQLLAIVNTSDSLTYSWTQEDSTLSCSDCPDPVAFPIASTEYIVTVVDTNGCQATDHIAVDVDKNRRVFIPTAFTPNGDGRNDKFIVYGGTGVVNIRSFRVFDRWGELIHQRDNFLPNSDSDGWDGRFRGQLLNPGVFVYFIEVEFSDGQVFPYKGDVTLIR